MGVPLIYPNILQCFLNRTPNYRKPPPPPQIRPLWQGADASEDEEEEEEEEGDSDEAEGLGFKDWLFVLLPAWEY